MGCATSAPSKYECASAPAYSWPDVKNILRECLATHLPVALADLIIGFIDSIAFNASYLRHLVHSRALKTELDQSWGSLAWDLAPYKQNIRMTVTIRVHSRWPYGAIKYTSYHYMLEMAQLLETGMLRLMLANPTAYVLYRAEIPMGDLELATIIDDASSHLTKIFYGQNRAPVHRILRH